MKIASSEIQMASVNLNQTNQSGSSVKQVQELIQDKVTLSQQQILTTSEASSTSGGGASTLNGSLSFLKDIFTQILNIVKN